LRKGGEFTPNLDAVETHLPSAHGGEGNEVADFDQEGSFLAISKQYYVELWGAHSVLL
jgi:hypothetical protein